MAGHARRASTHVQVGNKFTTIRFGCTDPHHEALVWMLIDLSGPHRHRRFSRWMASDITDDVELICVTADDCGEVAGSVTIEEGPFHFPCVIAGFADRSNDPRTPASPSPPSRVTVGRNYEGGPYGHCQQQRR